jgi:hypothetical protein
MVVVMDGREIAYRRLHGQRLVGPPLPDPVAVVRHLGAMQAQEYAVAKWAVGQRTTGADDATVQRLVDDGAILRTHALRPTWHFLAADDIVWIQELTGPRVHQFNAYYYRRLGIDDDTATKTNALIADAVAGGAHKTRRELAPLLAAAGFPSSGQGLAYVVMRAELDGVIANGPMRGKQHTYALLSERAPRAERLGREAALAELTWRFFSTHGPATVKDFAWWSSLTVAQIKEGLGLVGDRLASTVVDGKTLWFDPSGAVEPVPGVRMLQGFDEYVVAYSDTKFAFNVAGAEPTPGRYTDNMMFHPVVVDSQVVGYWRRIPKGKGLAVEVDVFAVPLTAAQRRALDAELQRHAAFATVPVEVTFV